MQHDSAGDVGLSEVRAPQPRIVSAVNWLGLWTLYSKEVHRFLKVYMQSVVAPVVTTLLFLAIFNIALGDRAALSGDVPYATFLASGLIVMSAVQNSFANTASSILIGKIQGNIVDLLMPPLSPAELAAGFALSGLTRGMLCALVVAAGMAVFVDLPMAHPWIAVFYAVAAGLLMALLGIIAGIWADKFDHMATVTNFVITPLAFLSGTFYSVDRLPETWQILCHANPFFYLIDGFRYGIIGRADGSLAIGSVMLVGLNVVLATVAVALLRRGWKLKT